MDDDNDTPVLSGSTLAALQEFYAERNDEERRADDLKSAIETGQKLSMDMFKEDWNASQFWYNEDTARTLAKQLLDDSTSETAVAVVSAPSAFIELKNILVGESRTEQNSADDDEELGYI
ncbi:MAG: hypothetical protein GOMPHAMPRED_004418 [Gomphillus americanus]|uniref:Uncharacterized protein n=1 Tax=Gomphillus americanus TaxID=1940652 RepID=A0A8H3FK83_9LECA|nr:MAG: hypothetical protein GOMPHAMPRED_004418 [Gomphillus americanus]